MSLLVTPPERGDWHSPYAGRSKEYVWSTMRQHLLGKITPTDIDFSIDRNGRVLFFEMKTDGATMTVGQEIHLETLARLNPGNVLVCVVHHREMEPVELDLDVVRFDLWRADANGEIVRSEGYCGELFGPFIESFFTWAEGDPDAIRRALST